jgi:LysR family hydrogen peroxide-inducible transcriptional activator
MIDLALPALPVTGSNFLSQEVLREGRYVVGPRDHRLAKQSTIHLKQVEKDPFLLLKEGHCFRDNTLSACGRARLDPNVVFESGQFTTILAMVAGTGVSVVPQMAVESRPGCRFIPLADEGEFRRVGIVQLKQHFRGRAHHGFLKHIQQPASAKLAMKMS